MKTLAPSITPTVLMVDDNPAFLESTVRVLRAAGISHPVITAGNATETINSIHTLEGPAILFVPTFVPTASKPPGPRIGRPARAGNV